jgi:hypothetical protein
MRHGRLAVYLLGRTLQSHRARGDPGGGDGFFRTPSTIAMLRMMLIGVLIFLPGGGGPKGPARVNARLSPFPGRRRPGTRRGRGG